MNELMIKDMPVDVNAKLNSDVRKNLSEVIESEFKNRLNVDYEQKNKARQEIIERHKKRLKIQNKLDEIRKKSIELDTLKKDMQRLGFGDNDGLYRNGNNSEIEEELASLNQTCQSILTIKNKLQTRLMLSTTVGEATVIMHEILGNTLIPSLTKNAITFQK